MCSYVCRLSTEHAGVLLPPQETLCRQAARISRAVSPSQGLAPELVVGLASGPPLLGLLADLVDHGPPQTPPPSRRPRHPRHDPAGNYWRPAAPTAGRAGS
eukprot:scaffold18774_cov101-Isochrysis_galbana.AAC.1